MFLLCKFTIDIPYGLFIIIIWKQTQRANKHLCIFRRSYSRNGAFISFDGLFIAVKISSFQLPIASSISGSVPNKREPYKSNNFKVDEIKPKKSSKFIGDEKNAHIQSLDCVIDERNEIKSNLTRSCKRKTNLSAKMEQIHFHFVVEEKNAKQQEEKREKNSEISCFSQFAAVGRFFPHRLCRSERYTLWKTWDLWVNTRLHSTQSSASGFRIHIYEMTACTLINNNKKLDQTWIMVLHWHRKQTRSTLISIKLWIFILKWLHIGAYMDIFSPCEGHFVVLKSTICYGLLNTRGFMLKWKAVNPYMARDTHTYTAVITSKNKNITHQNWRDYGKFMSHTIFQPRVICVHHCKNWNVQGALCGGMMTNLLLSTVYNSESFYCSYKSHSPPSTNSYFRGANWMLAWCSYHNFISFW